MDTRERKLKYYAKKYWRGTDSRNVKYSAYAIAQQMKKVGICKHDMDCYRLVLKGVEKLYRD